MLNQLLEHWKEIEPHNIKVTKRWYREARGFCKELASIHDLPVRNVAAIVSALSPSVSWDLNKRDAINFVRTRGQTNVSTYGNQARKARLLLNPDLTKRQVLQILGGDKTKSFFLNILEPMTTGPVTLDRHAYAALDINGSGYVSVGDRRGAKKAYREAAELVGLRPHEFQAIIWEHIRSK